MNFYNDLDKIYEDYNENHAKQAPPEMMESWGTLQNAFYDYLANYGEHSWKCGFMHAMKLTGKEV